MARYKLTLEYDGRGLVGWQRQANGPSVQALIEQAAENFCGQTTVCNGAGRTDAGVHALGQVAHVDFETIFPTDTVRDALNAYLRPSKVAVLDVKFVSDEFHSRFSATRREYLYIIINRRAPLTLKEGRAWLISKHLDIQPMQAACTHLLGKHDFTSFRAAECQAKSPVKTIDKIKIHRNGEIIKIGVAARSFLHRQVRNIVGTLTLVGEGKLQPDKVKAILEARDRTTAGPCAPADGLYLKAICYRKNYE
ncbi:MAG: tRNA pseudouridine(38-40) synthase TruA [Pseudomonadota bacterium]|nr:tRNA pseudouridine(38-40) synthase TruA [Pseudomonadota bacterium]